MKNLILRISDHNWSEIGPGDWDYTQWSIFDDFSVEIREKRSKTYGGENEDSLFSVDNTYISEDTLKEILKQLEKAKSVNLEVDAYDGEAWEFIQYDGDKIIWERKLGYIYGIEPLEEIAMILNNNIC